MGTRKRKGGGGSWLVVDGERKQREREKKCSAGCRPGP